MTARRTRNTFLSFCIIVVLFLGGCATPAEKSFVVLLPEEGKPSGEVVVVTPGGSQVLNKSWQKAEIPAPDERPAAPQVMDESAVRGVFAKVISAMPAPPVHFTLYFRLDSAELLPDSQLLLPRITKAVKERNPAELSVIGHTDTMGTDEHNYRLGLLRANTVAAKLKALGAVPAVIDTSSHGKSDLLVKTGDQVPEPRNRRAEVTVR